MRKKTSFKRIFTGAMALVLLLCQTAAYAETEKQIPLNIRIPLGNVMDPRAYFVGAVQREYVEDRAQEVAKQINLGNYMSDVSKTISSVTGELKWNYADGIAAVNTAKSQGATGFLSKREKLDFDDISFASKNEYSTLIAISLDNEPLAVSKRILVQAMTQEQLYGYSEKRVYTNTGEYRGKKEIVSLGEYPWNIRNIEASFNLKNGGDVFKISVLDENGYLREDLPWSTHDDGSISVNLKSNSIYTIVERGDTQFKSGQAEDATIRYVWWEGEDYYQTNFPAVTEFSESTLDGDKKDILSGGKWLTNEGSYQEGAEIPYITYKVDVKDDGNYNFFIRRFWKHGPFRFRFDDGEWKNITEMTLLDNFDLRRFLNVNWIPGGEVYLTKGEHTLTIEQIGPTGEALKPGNSIIGCYDAFVLVAGPFVPLGLLKPGEKLTNAAEGFFPFSPEPDGYTDSPIDLRYLNEEEAGQDGYMYAEGDKIYLASGKEERFWATNVGSDVMFADNATIDNFTRKMAKYGINLVRMHKGVLDDDLQISDEKVDRIQYFVNACKKNGIYVKFSFYFVLENNLAAAKEFAHNGRFADGLIEGFLPHQTEGYGYLIWNEKIQETYLKSMEKLLLAENPYGKTPLISEPAVAIIEIQNEDSLFFHTSGAWRWPQADQYRFAKIFGAWLIEKYGSINKALKAWGDIEPTYRMPTYTFDNYEDGAVAWQDVNDFSYRPEREDWLNKRRRDFREFTIELQKEFYQKMADRFREMGYNGMTIASNWITISHQNYDAVERYTYLPSDINDRHGYNTNFSGLENAPGDSRSSYAVVAGQKYFDESILYTPENMAVKTVHTKGQPSVISEITWTNPTKYSAEGPFLEAAYASLQGIDGIMNFASDPEWSKSLKKFPVNTPAMLGQFPAFALMYRRGDVTEAQVVAYEAISPESMYSNKAGRVFNGVNMDGFRSNSN